MTRKHFNAIAKALADARPLREDFDSFGRWSARVQYERAIFQWNTDCSAMADVCQSFNPAFDRTCFMEACNA